MTSSIVRVYLARHGQTALNTRSVRISITVFLLILSLTVTVGAHARWDRTKQALREKRSLPTDPLPRLMVAGVAIIIAGTAVPIFLAENAR